MMLFLPRKPCVWARKLAKVPHRPPLTPGSIKEIFHHEGKKGLIEQKFGNFDVMDER